MNAYDTKRFGSKASYKVLPNELTD